MPDTDDGVMGFLGLSDLVGRRLPGGCVLCTATQEFSLMTPLSPDITVLTVFHEADCPIILNQPPPDTVLTD